MRLMHFALRTGCYFALFYMHKVSIYTEIKNYDEFFAPVTLNHSCLELT